MRIEIAQHLRPMRARRRRALNRQMIAAPRNLDIRVCARSRPNAGRARPRRAPAPRCRRTQVARLARRRAASCPGFSKRHRRDPRFGAHSETISRADAARLCLRHTHARDIADRMIGRERHAPAADAGCARSIARRNAPVVSNSTSNVLPDEAVGRNRCSARSAAPAIAASRSSFTASGICLRAAAAGVPGRGEYLNENDCANPISRTRSQCRLEIRVAFAGKSDDEIRRQARCPAAPSRMRADEPAIVVRRMPAVHRLKHRIRSRLAPADAETASASLRPHAPQSDRRPCRADGWSCSATASTHRSAPGARIS